MSFWFASVTTYSTKALTHEMPEGVFVIEVWHVGNTNQPSSCYCALKFKENTSSKGSYLDSIVDIKQSIVYCKAKIKAYLISKNLFFLWQINVLQARKKFEILDAVSLCRTPRLICIFVMCSTHTEGQQTAYGAPWCSCIPCRCCRSCTPSTRCSSRATTYWMRWTHTQRSWLLRWVSSSSLAPLSPAEPSPLALGLDRFSLEPLRSGSCIKTSFRFQLDDLNNVTHCNFDFQKIPWKTGCPAGVSSICHCGVAFLLQQVENWIDSSLPKIDPTSAWWEAQPVFASEKWFRASWTESL